MTAKLLSKIYYSQGLKKARDKLFNAFDKSEISDEEFVNLTMLLGSLFSGKGNMTCHITKKPKPKNITAQRTTRRKKQSIDRG